jgi:hypothetical protein
VTSCPGLGIGHSPSGVPSPFFDDAAGRSTGIVDGYIGVPIAPDPSGKRALVISPFPLDPVAYVEVQGVRVSIDGEQQALTDARGFYECGSVGAGERALSVADPTGGFLPAEARITVVRGGITSGAGPAAESPSAPAAGYFPVGRDDVVRMRSLRGIREWRRAATPKIGDTGVYQVSFVAPGGAPGEEFLDISFAPSGLVLWGGDWGALDPPVTILASAFQLGDSHNVSTTRTPLDGSAAASATVSCVVSGVDDLVLTAGRFSNCPKLDLSVSGAGVSASWTIWVAWRVGPVKIITGGIDHQAEYAIIGGHEYP